MTGTPAPNGKSRNEQLRLVVFDNQEAEAPEENPTTSEPQTYLKNSNTPTEILSTLEKMPWLHSSVPPTLMENMDGGSLNLEVSESVLQRRETTIKCLHEKPFMQQEPINPREVEHSHSITIKVYTYGLPEQTLIRTLLELGRHTHHGFAGNFEMFTEDGTMVLYDYFAHDGEHLGHSEALTFVPSGDQHAEAEENL